MNYVLSDRECDLSSLERFLGMACHDVMEFKVVHTVANTAPGDDEVEEKRRRFIGLYDRQCVVLFPVHLIEGFRRDVMRYVFHEVTALKVHPRYVAGLELLSEKLELVPSDAWRICRLLDEIQDDEE